MWKSVKRVLKFLAAQAISSEKDPEFIDKTGDYDKAEIIKSYMPGQGK